MKYINLSVMFTMLIISLLSVSVQSKSLTEFILCDGNGKETGKTFTQVTITVPQVDSSGNYNYKGIEVAVFEKPVSVTKNTIIYNKRILTSSLNIQINDFGSADTYKQDKIYKLGYRCLYTQITLEDSPIIETDWNMIENNYFKIKTSQTKSIIFDDVPKNHWAYQEIMQMAQNGIISGYSNGKFNPNEKVTREQFAKMMVLTLKLPINIHNKASFKDVSKERWSYKYIESAMQYLSGYDDNYRPNQNATREEITYALVKAKGYQKETADTSRLKSLFKDYKTISATMAKYILIAYDKKLISGYDDGTFRPKGELTRAEAAVLLYKAKASK